LDGIDQREFRNAMGHFATGVTVVTTTTPEGPLGMTVNSFASVSLVPPLVLWSPARESDRFAAFEAASHFAIHVLPRYGRALAERFADSGTDFAGLAFAPGHGGVPLLDDFCARIECRHAAKYDGGDHLIVVGEVLRMVERDLPPLIFQRGDYCGLGPR
jgi:flavin reductase (DIM6/NTAB) family NADH-FMN oxidoreductase RutF